ncbi:tautomerase family protein [Novosphingobium profundi]|uniref:tautomerase family protein n=1 Tax=Novosphingobium profundi TaxID=1774954 RepID=UPI001BD9A375|nr:tautomerase family protein [Novosphingobium profundi]MBT0669289.1 tautomerase family protein [Novosphingobium profundi]
MPHVIVKVWPGKSDSQKRRLTDAIAASAADILGYGPDSVSIGIEEVPSGEWMTRVYAADIAAKWSSLAKQPGYGPGPAPSAPGEN